MGLQSPPIDALEIVDELVHFVDKIGQVVSFTFVNRMMIVIV